MMRTNIILLFAFVISAKRGTGLSSRESKGRGNPLLYSLGLRYFLSPRFIVV